MSPKTTVHGGPSNTEGDEAWAGTSSSTSTEPDESSTSSSEQPDQSPAPTTEPPSTPDLTADSSAASTDGESTTTSQSADQADPYDGWLNADLEDELEQRELPKTGNKAEKLARLREDDAAKAAVQE